MATVGLTLHRLTSQVNGMILKEKESLGGKLNPDIEIARDVGIAIENAKNAFDYSGALSIEMTKVDSVVKGHLGELEKLVSALVSKNREELVNVSTRAKKVADALSPHSWEPQLIGINPRYVAISEGKFTVSFLGKFKYTAQNSTTYPAMLKFGETFIRPKKVSADELIFEIGVPKFFPNVTSEKRDLSQCTLQVTYKTGSVWGTKIAEYKDIWVGALPLSPGKIRTIITSKQLKEEGSFSYQSPSIRFNGNGLEGQERVERVISVHPTPGRRIDMDSIQLKSHNHTKGDYTLDIIQKAPTQVTVKMGILPSSANLVEFHVEFKEIASILEETTETQEISLNWGEKKQHNVPLDGKVRIELDRFDGERVVFEEEDQTKPYLKVQKTFGRIELTAVPPS